MHDMVNPYFDELSNVDIDKETKICRRCDETKHYTEFAHRSYNKNGDKEYKNYCKDCDKIAQKQVANIKKNIGAVPDDHLCDCCGRDEQTILNKYRLFQRTMKKTVWTYDHDFKTGRFKGIICQPCNSVVGNLQDDIILADKVVKYIQKNYE